MVFHTRKLTTGTLTINRSGGVSLVSVQAQDSSSCTVQGSVGYDGVNSDALTIQNGQIFTVASQNSQNTIDGLVITWVSGTIDIVLGL